MKLQHGQLNRLTGLKLLSTPEGGTNTWSKRERGSPSSFLIPNITADLVISKKKPKKPKQTKNGTDEISLRYGACLQNLTAKKILSRHKTHLNQAQIYFFFKK